MKSTKLTICNLCKKDRVEPNINTAQNCKNSIEINEERNIQSLLEIKSLLQKETTNFKSLDKDISRVRARSFDWLYNVCKLTSLKDLTCLQAADIYEKALSNYDYQLSIDDFHLISIISLMLSVKINEVKSFTLDFVINKIGHNKFDKDSIINAESFVLKTINFKLPKNHFIDFISIFIETLIFNTEQNSNNQITHCDYKSMVFKMCKIVYKVTSFSHKLVNKYEKLPLYISIIYSSVCMVEKTGLFKSHFTSKLFFNLTKQLDIEMKVILQVSCKIDKFIKDLTRQQDRYYLLKDFEALKKAFTNA